MSRDDEIGEGVARGFRSAWLEDRLAGRKRSVSEYLEDYPREFWDLIAGEFDEIEQAAAAKPHAAPDEEKAEAGVVNLGTTLPAHYRIISELGRGGQATVFLAEDQRLHRQVALKVLAPGSLGSVAAVQRFRREAEVASRLRHPGICTILEAGAEEDSAYIAMQYVEGQSLGQRIREMRDTAAASTVPSLLRSGEEGSGSGAGDASHPSSSRVRRHEVMTVVKLVEDVAYALHAAHEAGVVHRDIKPTNIMVDSEGRSVLTDFGLARQEDSDLPTLTRTGELFGTPAYMSPEQLTRQAIHLDRRSDVWSLGVTLYECLALRRPFEAATREQLYLAIMGREPPNARRLNPAIPRDLGVVLETALEKNRERRYQTALDFAEDLRRVREGEPTRARPVPLIGRAWRWVRRKPAKAVAVAALLCALITAAYLAAWWSDLERARAAALVNRVDTILQAAYAELGHGRPARAREAFEQALEDDPASPEARSGAALACLKLGDVEAAAAVLEAGTADPRLVWARGAVLRAQGRREEGRELERRAHSPRDAISWFLSGEHALDRGHQGHDPSFATAVNHFHRAVFSAPAPRALYFQGLADAADHVGDAAACRRVAAAFILHWPEDARAWDWAGYAMTGVDPETALRHFDEALRLDSRALMAHLHRDIVLGRLGRREEAEASYLAALDVDESFAKAWNQLGMNRIQLGLFAEAAEAFDRVLALAPEDARCWHNRGIAALRLGNLEEATDMFREATRLGPRNGGPWSVLIGVLREQGRLAEAIDVGKRGAEVARDKAGVLNDLGIALDVAGSVEEALATYQKALEVRPDYSEAWNNYAMILEKADRMEEAISAYAKAVACGPDNITALDNLRILSGELWEAGDIRAAERGFRCIVGSGHPSAGDHCNHGMSLFALDRFEEAVLAHDKALDLDNGHAQSLCNRGHALRRLGRLREALDSMRKGHELAQARGGWSWDSETWVADLEHYVGVESRLDEIVTGSEAPLDVGELDGLAQVCSVQRRWADGAGIWKEAFDRWPALGADRAAGRRFRGARFAARAGTGEDRGELDAATRAAWRDQALEWLTEELRSLRRAADNEEIRSGHLVKLLESWQQAEAFAALREPAALGTLPDAEDRAWSALWRAVSDLRAALE